MVDGEVEHGWKREALWAPFLVGCRYGPSVWAPRREADDGIERGAREGRICGLVLAGALMHVSICSQCRGLKVGRAIVKMLSESLVSYFGPR